MFSVVSFSQSVLFSEEHAVGGVVDVFVGVGSSYVGSVEVQKLAETFEVEDIEFVKGGLREFG